MPKRKLKAALDKHQGVDHKLEKQKKTQKQAEKRKRQKLEPASDAQEALSASALKEAKRLEQTEQRLAEEALAADAAELLEAENGGEVGGWETDESEVAVEQQRGGVDVAALDDESDSESDEDEIVQNDTNGLIDDAMEEDEAEEDDIPLSDIESLASDEKGDVIPHQRLTINNTAALQRSLKSFALPSTLPFSAVQSVTSAEPVQIADVEDDLNRELAFYKQSLDAVKEARHRLKKEGVPFSRPPDFFAEMVKSEEQMGKVRQKMVDEAARKKASADARRQRDLKKFGKAVQVAKLQERDKAKRDTMDKINVLKRSKFYLLPYTLAIMSLIFSIQNGKEPTSMPTRTTCSMSRWRMLRRRRKLIARLVEAEMLLGQIANGKRRMRNLGSGARSALRRATMQSLRVMSVGTPQGK